MVLACPYLRALFKNHPKILPNALVEQVARQIAFERVFFQAPSSQNGSRGTLVMTLGPSSALLGRSWASLGALLGALAALWGPSWGALGHL